MALQFIGPVQRPQSEWDMIAGAIGQGLDFRNRLQLMRESPEYQMAQAKLQEFRNQQEAIQGLDPTLRQAALTGFAPTEFMNEAQMRQRGINQQALADPRGLLQRQMELGNQAQEQAISMNELAHRFNQDTYQNRVKAAELGVRSQEEELSQRVWMNTPEYRQLYFEQAKAAMDYQKAQMSHMKAMESLQGRKITSDENIARMQLEAQKMQKATAYEQNAAESYFKRSIDLQQTLSKQFMTRNPYTAEATSNMFALSQGMKTMYGPYYNGGLEAATPLPEATALNMAQMWNQFTQGLINKGVDQKSAMYQTAEAEKRYWERSLSRFPEAQANYNLYASNPMLPPEEGIVHWLKSQFGVLSNAANISNEQKGQWNINRGPTYGGQPVGLPPQGGGPVKVDMKKYNW